MSFYGRPGSHSAKSLGLGWFLFLFIDCGSLGNFILNFPARIKSAEIKNLLFCVHESFQLHPDPDDPCSGSSG